MLQLFQLLGVTSGSGGGGTTDPTPQPSNTVTPETRRISFTGNAVAPSGLPEGTRTFSEAVDPYDILDYEIDTTGLLESGEAIDSAVLSLPTEAALLGLTIVTTGGYATTRNGNIIKFYLSIADGDQNNKAFNTGIYLPIELRIITNSIPARRKQRTIAVRVVQR